MTGLDGHELLALPLICSAVGNLLFVERPWLRERVGAFVADPATRFLPLTGERGAGQYPADGLPAEQRPTAPRHLIRRDSRSPPTGPPAPRPDGTGGSGKTAVTPSSRPAA